MTLRQTLLTTPVIMVTRTALSEEDGQVTTSRKEPCLRRESASAYAIFTASVHSRPRRAHVCRIDRCVNKTDFCAVQNGSRSPTFRGKPRTTGLNRKRVAPISPLELPRGAVGTALIGFLI